MKLKALPLFLLSLFSIIHLKAQNYNEERARMEIIEKFKNSALEKTITVLSFEEWQALYDWTHATNTDLTKYGFDRYSKFTQSGKLYGILKLASDTITKAMFEVVIAAFNGGVVVANNNKVGMVDSIGNLAIPTQYDEIIPFSGDRGFVMKDGKYAAITYTGKLLTPFLFDNVGGFSNGVSLVIEKGRGGYIDRNGKYIAQAQFNDATQFVRGFAKIYFDKWETIYKGEATQGRRTTNVDVGYTKSIPFLLNSKGAKIFTGKDGDDIAISENAYALIGRNVYIDGDKYYFESMVDTAGRVIIPFDRKLNITALTKDWIIVKNLITGHIGVINYAGTELLKTTFSAIEPLKYNDGKLGKVFFDDNNFFYIDKNCKCIEFEGIKCPDKE